MKLQHKIQTHSLNALTTFETPCRRYGCGRRRERVAELSAKDIFCLATATPRTAVDRLSCLIGRRGAGFRH
jgi:hypothetical protein